MIKTTMKTKSSNRNRYLVITASLLFLLTTLCAGVLLTSQLSHAAFLSGNPGAPPSGGGGSGYHTSHGHGWKLYTIGGGGPAAFQDGSSWASVSSQCSGIGANKVWVYVIRNSGGSEKAYTFENTNNDYGYNNTTNRATGGSGRDWWVDRPLAGGDPYKYNSSGNYTNSWTYGGSVGYGHGHAEDVVRTVREKYQKEGGSLSSWGFSVGWFCYNDIPPWSVSVASSADRSTAKPGDKITWEHTVKNEGPNPTHTDVTYHYRNKQGLGDYDGPDDYILKKGATKNQTDSFNSTYNVTDDDVNKNLCRETNASPKSSTSTAWVWTNPPACVFVPYNYNLTPTITSSPAIGEVGGEVVLNGSVANSGDTKSQSVTWQATMFSVNSGGLVPSGGTSSAAPEVFYNSGFGAEAVDTGKKVFFKGNNVLDISPEVIGEYPVGTKVCFGLSVQPYAHDSGEWRHSDPTCTIIGKRPKVQIWGGDLKVGTVVDISDITTATSQKLVGSTDLLFGSWAEYGVIANGFVSGIGSGAAYVGGKTSSNFCLASLITFTNAESSSCQQETKKGGYKHNLDLFSVTNAYTVDDATPAFISLGDGTMNRVEVAKGSLTIAGGTIEKGNWLVINAAEQTVTISGDIRYADDTLNTISDIPQLVIIANRINITGAVRQLDAWLLATGDDGVISTCSDYPVLAPLTIDRCNQSLVVNGPVAAKSLYLRRTAGVSSGDPAEVFNLRPDAYLWATRQAAKAGKVWSVHTRELPPRF